jgi:hypothetical protein
VTSIERINRLLRGEPIDRPVIFDLLRNEPAIEHYAGERLTLENAARVVPKAVGAALDCTRTVRLPQAEGVNVLPDGRKLVIRRWTVWTEPKRFASADDYAEHLLHSYVGWPTDPEALREQAERTVDSLAATQRDIGDAVMFWPVGVQVGLHALHAEVGLDRFALYLYDCPGAISEAVESITAHSVALAHAVGRRAREVGAGTPVIMLGEDIAQKGATMFSPAFFRREFMPRLKRIIDACHAQNWKVMFHSDGNVMGILDDLVEAGMDLLNPTETVAGMDIAEIHRRYPWLIMVGVIDVSDLLPFGTPRQVRDAVTRAIDDSEGHVMIGSSTEMNETVSLANVLAVYETVREYRY